MPILIIYLFLVVCIISSSSLFFFFFFLLILKEIPKGFVQISTGIIVNCVVFKHLFSRLLYEYWGSYEFPLQKIKMCFDIISVFVASLSKHGLALLLLQTKHVSLDVQKYNSSASHFPCLL